MTNTNDFRRYSYQHDTSYMLQGFDVSRSSAAPKRRQAPTSDFEEERKLTLRENAGVKSASLINQEQQQSFKKAVALLTVAACVLAILALTIQSFALKNELTREISSTQIDISNAQSENISLQSQLDAMVSVSMIDEYAVEKLHMTKMKSSQMQYIDVNEYQHNRMSKLQKDSPANMAKHLGNN